jgi:hypothetical protein
VPDEKVHRLADTLPFMDWKGLRFYLPRFMLFALQHRDRTAAYRGSEACEVAIQWGDVRYTSGNPPPWTPAQRDAVQAFIEHFRDDDLLPRRP